MLRSLLAVLVLALAAPAQPQSSADAQRNLFNRPLAPFRIIGNVYYVGTLHVGAYLVTDPGGHVLIDGGPDAGAMQISANIVRLGFRLEDVRYLLINHAHWDHAAGLAELKRRSGARLAAGAGDAPDLARGFNADRDDTAHFPPVAVDREVGEGDAVTVGGIALVAHPTPGHTRGCTTWTMRVREGGATYDVMFTCSLTVAGERLVGNARYPGVVRDFEATFARLRRLRADVFLGFHDTAFDLEAKRACAEAGDRLAFVDPDEAGRRIHEAEAAFRAELATQQGRP